MVFIGGSTWAKCKELTLFRHLGEFPSKSGTVPPVIFGLRGARAGEADGPCRECVGDVQAHVPKSAS